MTDRGLKYLLRFKLKELDIHACQHLTVKMRNENQLCLMCLLLQVQTLHNINKYSENLQSLHIGNSVQVLPNYLQPEGTFSDSDSEVGLDGNIYEKQGYVIKCPKLRKLCIRDLFVNRGPLYFDLLLKPLQELTHLDLSGAFHKEGMGNFGWLLSLPKLLSVTLHNIQGMDDWTWTGFYCLIVVLIIRRC